MPINDPCYTEEQRRILKKADSGCTGLCVLDNFVRNSFRQLERLTDELRHLYLSSPQEEVCRLAEMIHAQLRILTENIASDIEDALDEGQKIIKERDRFEAELESAKEESERLSDKLEEARSCFINLRHELAELGQTLGQSG